MWLLPAATLPAAAEKPGTSVELHDVDFLLVNRICYVSRDDSRRITHCERWYVSFWTVHWYPTVGTMKVPVLCNRGWVGGAKLIPCSHGWAIDVAGKIVVGKRAFMLQSDFDFERRHRQWYQPIHGR